MSSLRLPSNDTCEAGLPWEIASSPNQGGGDRLVSSGPVARFEDDHRCLGRPPAGIRVELRIDRNPALWSSRDFGSRRGDEPAPTEVVGVTAGAVDRRWLPTAEPSPGTSHPRRD